MKTSSITELDEHPRRTEEATNLVTRSTEGSTEISGERVGEMIDDVKPKHHNFAEKEKRSDLGVKAGSDTTKTHESDVAPVVMKPVDQKDGTKAGELLGDLKVPKPGEKGGKLFQRQKGQKTKTVLKQVTRKDVQEVYRSRMRMPSPPVNKSGRSDDPLKIKYQPRNADDAWILGHSEWQEFARQHMKQSDNLPESKEEKELYNKEQRCPKDSISPVPSKVVSLTEKTMIEVQETKTDGENSDGVGDQVFPLVDQKSHEDDSRAPTQDETKTEDSWGADMEAFLPEPGHKQTIKLRSTSKNGQVSKTRSKTEISTVESKVAVPRQHDAKTLDSVQTAKAKTASKKWQPKDEKKIKNPLVKKKHKTNQGVIEVGVKQAGRFVKATRSVYITGDTRDKSNSHPRAREIRNTWQKLMKPILIEWTYLYSKNFEHDKKVKWCIQYVADTHLSGLTKPPPDIGLGHWQICQPILSKKDQYRYQTSVETKPTTKANERCCRCTFQETILKPNERPKPCSNAKSPCRDMTKYKQGVNVYVLNDVLYYEPVRSTMARIMQSRKDLPTLIFYSYHKCRPGTFSTPDGGLVTADGYKLVQKHGVNDKQDDVYTTDQASLPKCDGFKTYKLLEWTTFEAGYLSNVPLSVDLNNIPVGKIPFNITSELYKNEGLPSVDFPAPNSTETTQLRQSVRDVSAQDNQSEVSSVSFTDSSLTGFSGGSSVSVDDIVETEVSDQGCLYDALFDPGLAKDVATMKTEILDHMAAHPEHFFLLRYRRRHCRTKVKIDDNGVDCSDYIKKRRDGKEAGAREILAFCSRYKRTVLVKTGKYRKVYGDTAPHETDHQIKFSDNHYYRISNTSGKKTRMVTIPDLGLDAEDIRMRWLHGGSEAMGLVSTIDDSDEGAGSETSTVSLFAPSQTSIRATKIPGLSSEGRDAENQRKNNLTVNLLSDPTRIAWVTNGWRQEIWVGPGGVWSGPNAEDRASLSKGRGFCVSLPPKAAVNLVRCLVANLPSDLETLKDKDKLIGKLLATAATASTAINTQSESLQVQCASYTACDSWSRWFTLAYANKVVDDVERMLDFVQEMKAKSKSGGKRKGYCCAGSQAVLDTLNSRDRPNLRFFVDKESAQSWLEKVNGAVDGGFQPYAALVLDSHAFSTYGQHVVENADGHNIFENFARRVGTCSRQLAAEIASLPVAVRDLFFDEQDGPKKWINVFLMDQLKDNIFDEKCRNQVQAMFLAYIRSHRSYHLRHIPTHKNLYPGEIERNFGFDIVKALIAKHPCSNRETRQIGPSFTTKPLCAQTCFANLLVAFITRQAGGKPREGGPLVASKVDQLPEAMIRMISGYRNSEPLSRTVLASQTAEDNQFTANATVLPTFSEWLDGYGGQAAAKMIDMHFKVQRNEREMANVTNVDRNITGFVKLEFHGEEEGGLAYHSEPRIISDRCVDFKYNGIGVTKQLSKILQELTPCYAVYDNPRKVADDIAAYINIHGTDLVARNTDYSRMDGSTCQKVKEQINECYEKLFEVIEKCPATLLDHRTTNARESFFASLDQAAISPYNLPYRQQFGWRQSMKGFTLGTVASGDFHTTIGNTLLNLLINFQALEAVSKILDRRLIHGEDFFLRVTGDDGLLLTTPAIAEEYDEQVVRIAEQYGMSLKIDVANVQPVTYERQMAFCSHIFIPTSEGVMVMRPLKRSLTRIGWSLNKQLDDKGLLKAKVLSELTWAEKVPVVGAFYTALFNEVQGANIALERGTRFKLYSHISGNTETEINRFRQDLFGNLKPRLALLSEKKINKRHMTTVIKDYASRYTQGVKEFLTPSEQARIGFCNLTGLSIQAQLDLEDRFSTAVRTNLLENLPIDFLNWLDGVPGME
jgi:hypothetical protein